MRPATVAMRAPAPRLAELFGVGNMVRCSAAAATAAPSRASLEGSGSGGSEGVSEFLCGQSQSRARARLTSHRHRARTGRQSDRSALLHDRCPIASGALSVPPGAIRKPMANVAVPAYRGTTIGPPAHAVRLELEINPVLLRVGAMRACRFPVRRERELDRSALALSLSREPPEGGARAGAVSLFASASALALLGLTTAYGWLTRITLAPSSLSRSVAALFSLGHALPDTPRSSAGASLSPTTSMRRPSCALVVLYASGARKQVRACSHSASVTFARRASPSTEPAHEAARVRNAHHRNPNDAGRVRLTPHARTNDVARKLGVAGHLRPAFEEVNHVAPRLRRGVARRRTARRAQPA